jgi:HAD superfamily hydrolase (TIGR01459 family)
MKRIAMDKLQFKPLLATLDDYDVYLFDLWGVIVEGTEVYPGVVDVINQISKQRKVFFVSNAPRPKLASFERLKSWGLELTQDAVFTSGELAREMMLASEKRLNISSPVVYHLGADRNSEILEGLDLSVTEYIARANILLLTLYRDEGNDLTEFDDLLRDAAKKHVVCICANPDTIIPNLGKNRYCSGYFAQKFEDFGGRVIYTGKPHIEIFDQVNFSIDFK